MTQTNNTKDIKRWMVQSAKDYLKWLNNSADNDRKIICATLLEIQELEEHLRHYNVVDVAQLQNIENALNTIHRQLTNNKFI